MLWHAYIRLAARIYEDGGNSAERLMKLSQPYHHLASNYDGDLFSRDNPAWTEHAVIAPGKRGPRVLNNRQARQGAFELLCEVTGVPRLQFARPRKQDAEEVSGSDGGTSSVDASDTEDDVEIVKFTSRKRG